MKIRALLSDHKKIVILILAILFVCSVLNLFNAGVSYAECGSHLISKEQFENLPYSGYDVIPDEDGNKYVPINGDPHVFIQVPADTPINGATVFLNCQIPADTTVQLYYAMGGEALSEERSVFGSVSTDGRAVTFEIPGDVYATLRLDIEASFSVNSVELHALEGIIRTLSMPSLVLMIVCIASVALLGIFEKRLGYFRYVNEKLRAQAREFKKRIDEKRYVYCAVRFLSSVTVLALAVSYVIVLNINLFTHAASVYLFVLSILATVSVICDLALNYRSDTTARGAFIVLLIVGIFMSFALPKSSNVSWDDQIHYSRTLDLKCMLFKNEKTAADESVYSLLIPYSGIEHEAGRNISLLLRDEIVLESNRSFENVYLYIGYLPAALGMAIGELLEADFLKTFFFARVAQVITYAAVLYFAFKRLRGGALIFASVCLLPTAVFLATTFAYDWWVNCLIALGYAIFISEMRQRDKKMTLKDTLIMLSAMVLGCGPKAIYFFMFVPLLFMANEKFDDKRDAKRYRIMVLCSMAVVLASFLLPFLLNTDSQSDLRGGEGVNATEQLKFVLTSPFVYAKILIDFLLDYISIDFASVNMVFYAYLGSPRSICGTIAVFAMLYCALTDKVKDDDFKGVRLFKTVSWVTVAVQLALVATALYIAFTPVGSNTVNGCQYRYIFPILLPALYSLGSVRVGDAVDKRMSFALAFTMLSLNLFFSFYEVYIGKII